MILFRVLVVAAMHWQAGSIGNPRPTGTGRLIYDEHRRQVILIDSEAPAVPPASPALLRTWRWDGREWILLPGEGPIHRVVNAAVYDSSRRRIVMFGGITLVPRTGSLPETWEVDGATWTRWSRRMRTCGSGMDKRGLRSH